MGRGSGQGPGTKKSPSVMTLQMLQDGVCRFYVYFEGRGRSGVGRGGGSCAGDYTLPGNANLAQPSTIIYDQLLLVLQIYNSSVFKFLHSK